MLADLGGFYEFAWLAGTFLSMIFINKLSDNKIVAKMYKKNTEAGKEAKEYLREKFETDITKITSDDIDAIKTLMTGKSKMAEMNSCQSCCFECRIKCQPMFARCSCCRSNACCKQGCC